MANHGYFPRDGSRVPRSTIIKVFKEQLGVSESATNMALDNAFRSGLGDKENQLMGMADLRIHGPNEHDVSLVRNDAYFGDNSAVDLKLLDQFVKFPPTGNS